MWFGELPYNTHINLTENKWPLSTTLNNGYEFPGVGVNCQMNQPMNELPDAQMIGLWADSLLNDHSTLDPGGLERPQDSRHDIVTLDPFVSPDQMTSQDQNFFIDYDLATLDLLQNIDVDAVSAFPQGDDNVQTEHCITDAISNNGNQKSANKDSKCPRRKFNSCQNVILDQWILSHDEPYPTGQDKIGLSQQTGLSVRQVSSWFTRARQRKLQRIDPRNFPQTQNTGHIRKNVAMRSPSREIDIIFPDPWMRCTSLPIVPKDAPEDHCNNQRSQSLPPYHTLSNAYQQIHRELKRVDEEMLSLDVMPSAQDDVNSLVSLAGASFIEQHLHLGFGSHYRRETSKTA